MFRPLRGQMLIIMQHLHGCHGPVGVKRQQRVMKSFLRTQFHFSDPQVFQVYYLWSEIGFNVLFDRVRPGMISKRSFRNSLRHEKESE